MTKRSARMNSSSEGCFQTCLTGAAGQSLRQFSSRFLPPGPRGQDVIVLETMSTHLTHQSPHMHSFHTSHSFFHLSHDLFPRFCLYKSASHFTFEQLRKGVNERSSLREPVESPYASILRSRRTMHRLGD